MPNGLHTPHSTPRARNGEPQPAPPPNMASEPATRRDLTSWWKTFSKRGNIKKDEEKEPEVRGIFGVPLITSIPYANVAISLFNETGESYIYGYVPIVVAKCGVFLKEKATDVEGIFRLAGSEKRIKELKIAFDTPPRWGKGLDWTGYTVHDAANILRRYFNQLPEPIIPLQHYASFRQPLVNHQAEAVGPLEGQSPSIGGFDPVSAVRVYQHLIKELPSLNRQLLLYILDLLAVFAAKSDVNKMTTSNLAAIFQPGILSHPQHDMSPQDYRLSQDVLIFLIDNQDHFLIGMEGTAVDEGTVKHIESGPSTPSARTPTTPGRNKSGIGRSASAASSAGAESLRKFGGVRRNVSTSSRHSRHSGAIPSPVTPSFGTPTSGSGVHRSNTLPSKKSPALPGARFARDKHSDPPTPGTEDTKPHTPTSGLQNVATVYPESSEPVLQPATSQRPVDAKAAHEERIDVVEPSTTERAPVPVQPGTPDVISPAESTDATPTNVEPSASSAQILGPPTPQRYGRPSPHLTPTREKSEFIEGPLDPSAETGGEPTPGAVRTFTQILSKVSPSGDEKNGRRPNKLQKKRIPSSSNPSAHSSTHSLTGYNAGVDAPPSPLPPPGSHYFQGSSKEFQSFHSDTMSSRNSGQTLKPSMSPSASFRSHSTATEYSEAEPTDEPPKEEKKKFWKGHRRGESKATPTASQTDLGSVPGAEKSMSSFGSGSAPFGRRSLQFDSQQGSETSSMPYSPESKEVEKKGPLSWLRERRREHKESEAKKQRAKSPPSSMSDLSGSLNVGRSNEGLAVRGRSMDIPRNGASEGSKGSDVTPTPMSPQPLAQTTSRQTSNEAMAAPSNGSPQSPLRQAQATQAPLQHATASQGPPPQAPPPNATASEVPSAQPMSPQAPIPQATVPQGKASQPTQAALSQPTTSQTTQNSASQPAQAPASQPTQALATQATQSSASQPLPDRKDSPGSGYRSMLDV